ncbi:hypothetical protein ACHQM5_022784 [Ranunculus cassubicifolius]
MEIVGRAMDAILRAANNNIVINTFLLGSFGALTIRSMNQNKIIEALEIEHDSLLKSNKSMKRSLWDWKQQLYAEAAADEKNSPVPLGRIREIYGEAPTVPQSESVAKETKTRPTPM